ncbi:hypothetical protein [Spirulina sp. CS-785/01]|nr:hypothetical protein [Spirulina sp. CS-785/01]
MGKLEGNSFTQHKEFYTIQSLDKLVAAINFIFRQCEQQLQSLLAA